MNDLVENPEYLPLSAARRRYGISVKALRRLIAAGKLRGYRPTWKLLVAVKDLDALVRDAVALPMTEGAAR
jgi:hypothetical protein